MAAPVNYVVNYTVSAYVVEKTESNSNLIKDLWKGIFKEYSDYLHLYYLRNHMGNTQANMRRYEQLRQANQDTRDAKEAFAVSLYQLCEPLAHPFSLEDKEGIDRVLGYLTNDKTTALHIIEHSKDLVNRFQNRLKGLGYPPFTDTSTLNLTAFVIAAKYVEDLAVWITDISHDRHFKMLNLKTDKIREWERIFVQVINYDIIFPHLSKHTLADAERELLEAENALNRLKRDWEVFTKISSGATLQAAYELLYVPLIRQNLRPKLRDSIDQYYEKRRDLDQKREDLYPWKDKAAAHKRVAEIEKSLETLGIGAKRARQELEDYSQKFPRANFDEDMAAYELRAKMQHAQLQFNSATATLKTYRISPIVTDQKSALPDTLLESIPAKSPRICKTPRHAPFRSPNSCAKALHKKVTPKTPLARARVV